MMNLVAIPTIFGSSEMTVQSITFLDDGRYQIQTAAIDRIQQHRVWNCTREKDSRNIQPRRSLWL